MKLSLIIRVVGATTLLTVLLAVALAWTQYVDTADSGVTFWRWLHIYAIGVIPWYVAAPLTVLVAYRQASQGKHWVLIAIETVILALAVGALHVLNLALFMAPLFGVTISEYLSTLGLRDWMWDILIFVVAILCGHLWGRRNRDSHADSSADSSTKIIARSASRMDIVKIVDVTAASAQGNYVALITDQSEFLHRTTLGDMKDQLTQHGFVQVHRSHLVRADAIISASRSDGRIREIKITNGKTFPVSAGYQNAISTILQTDGLGD